MNSQVMLGWVSGIMGIFLKEVIFDFKTMFDFCMFHVFTTISFKKVSYVTNSCVCFATGWKLPDHGKLNLSKSVGALSNCPK